MLTAKAPAHERIECVSRFLADLKHRDAYLRPVIQLKRVWLWDHIVAPGSYGALVSEIRAAVAEVLAMLDEPLPPACTSFRWPDAIELSRGWLIDARTPRGT